MENNSSSSVMFSSETHHDPPRADTKWRDASLLLLFIFIFLFLFIFLFTFIFLLHSPTACTMNATLQAHSLKRTFFLSRLAPTRLTLRRL